MRLREMPTGNRHVTVRIAELADSSFIARRLAPARRAFVASPAFVARHGAPVLAKAAMEGRLPRGFCVKRLTDLPMLWSEQWRAIGLQEPVQIRAELG